MKNGKSKKQILNEMYHFHNGQVGAFESLYFDGEIELEELVKKVKKFRDLRYLTSLKIKKLEDESSRKK